MKSAARPPRFSRSSVLAALVCATALPAQQPTHYSTQVLADEPFLYWSFDESEGGALQLAALTADPVAGGSELVPVGGATRGPSLGKLGTAAVLDGVSYFETAALVAGKSTLAGPWAVEFWMKVDGDNSAERQDYLLNFGNSPGGDNAPAFIYDFKPDELEVFHGPRTDAGPVVADDQWHHVLWVFYGDGTTGVAGRPAAARHQPERQPDHDFLDRHRLHAAAERHARRMGGRPRRIRQPGRGHAGARHAGEILPPAPVTRRPVPARRGRAREIPASHSGRPHSQ